MRICKGKSNELNLIQEIKEEDAQEQIRKMPVDNYVLTAEIEIVKADFIEV